MAKGTKDDPWKLKTPPGTSDIVLWRDPDATPPALVCFASGTELRYHISAPEDLARVSFDIAETLCARLQAEGQGGRRFELTFHRLDGRAERLTIGLSLPGLLR